MKHLYFFVLFTIVFSSCSPLRVVRLDPEREPDRILYGNKILEERPDGALIEANFYDATPEYIVFDLLVQNTGPEPFDFYPGSAQLTPNIGLPIPALDPEMELLNRDIGEITRQKNDRIMAWAGAALLVAGAVAASTDGSDVPDIGGNNTAQLVSDISFNVADAVLFTIVDNDARRRRAYATSAVPTPDFRNFWLDHALRVTTIHPGEQAFGKLVFPRQDEAQRFELTVKVNGQEVGFPFRQRVYRPD